MRTMLIDTDESGLDLLDEWLTGYGNFEIVDKLTRPEQAIEIVRQERVEVVFLEIQLSYVNGIQIAESLLQTDPTIAIVFVTAQNHFATEAFELGVVDYILKPVAPNRLHKTVNRLRALREAGTQSRHVASRPVRGPIPECKDVFFCFGKFEWISGRQSMTAVKWRRSKERELMAYLLHHRGQIVAKGKIMEELWPTTSPDQAGAFLHTCVYNIRKMIIQYDCQAILEYRNNGYRYEMQEAWCDREAFEQLFEDNLRFDSANLSTYENIASLYRGDYLEQDEFEWARERREKLKNQYIYLMKRLAEFYRSENRLQEAEHCLRTALEKNPYLDDINELLLTVYALQGDRHAMIRHFNEFSNLLHEELGIDPMESTFRLYQQLCSGISCEVKME